MMIPCSEGLTMPLEIERKFLVRTEMWKPAGPGIQYTQGYIVTGPPASVRVRIAGDRAYVTIKKDRGVGVRAEFEYEIPACHASEMLDELCEGRVVDKVRHIEPYRGHRWEVDVFRGSNQGLIVAEIELVAADEAFEMPPWAGDEVTDDRRYLNSYLSQHPYTAWAGKRSEEG